MCGRVILTLSAKMIRQILAEEYDINDLNIDDFVPRYNLGPSQDMLSIIKHNGDYRSGYLKWRFIPSYAKNQNDGYKYINARSETVHEKVTYREAFSKRRCLLICNGFYEWKRSEVKKPFLFHRKDFNLITLAGIWQPQHLDDGSKEYGFSIVTTEANEVMAPIHHRMPVILDDRHAKLWLDQSTSFEELQHLMKPIHKDYLSCYEVSDYVNNVRNQDEICIQSIQ
ncbi:SOS response-associated peptidase [Acidaminobacter sp. JC074]|uniref:SOS response-associated peptidase n=1 Tax=Acidaminobacter sp. JC074 TaxID=2530199 RepID=UPI001F10010C|nr:SOS response-associated peptidase [Acidaminobacter sp. JC074]MCH4888463.1 SOS response-associated peptidase [Acidaminobacter sp. JC074]